MKYFLVVLAILTIFSLAPAQEHKSGDKELLFSFGGFSYLDVSNINKGAGFRYWLSPDVSGRGTLGFTSSNGDDQTKEFSTSLAALVDLGHTNNTAVYAGPTLGYYHNSDQSNVYAFGGCLGAEFTPWDHVTFGAEYGLNIYSLPGITRVQFGETTGSVILSVAF
jgi:hypothetical protein